MIQGVYNCYDESTKNNIEWVYLLIAMAPPVAQPCYTMSEIIDRDVNFYQINIFCPYRRNKDGNYLHEELYPTNHVNSQHRENAAQASDVCTNGTTDTSLDCLKPVHKKWEDVEVKQDLALNLRNQISCINFGQQMVAFPYEAWQLAYNSVQYPLEKAEDNLLQPDSSQNEDYLFILKMVLRKKIHSH
ncbi:Cell division cycle 7-related protein kinase [Trichuris trichiura]|uniref:Cell division cycle 7-related protein kinase n=1 Tax=Trichuris trichiura TaxID=36087 RepID=A0A077ZNQ5_TRITR|nr:Cell division cycle 7-related protein kinase [Trichuris trichiura]